MAFRFSLETVLRLRRSLEDKERLRLLSLLARRSAQEQEAGDVEEIRARLRENTWAAPDHIGIPALEMHWMERRAQACELHLHRLREALARLEQEIVRQTKAVVEHSRAREVIEKIREHQLARYETELSHRSQAQLEEMHVLRLTRRKVAE